MATKASPNRKSRASAAAKPVAVFEPNYEEVVAPFAAFNKLVFDNVEKLVTLQVNSAEKYAQMGLDSWKACLDIKNPEDLQAYAKMQQDTFQDVTSTLIADAKVFGEIGGAFVSDARKLVQENVEKVTKKAA